MQAGKAQCGRLHRSLSAMHSTLCTERTPHEHVTDGNVLECTIQDCACVHGPNGIAYSHHWHSAHHPIVIAQHQCSTDRIRKGFPMERAIPYLPFLYRSQISGEISGIRTFPLLADFRRHFRKPTERASQSPNSQK